MTERAAPESHSVEILYVEDNPNDAELTLRALKRRNLANSLHWVKDGEEALDFLFARGSYADREAQRVPRLVLLDLKLPKVGGLQVLQQVREDERTRAVPIVVLTSSREEKDMVESYRLGVNSYIVKPVEFDNFVKAVTEVGMYWLLVNQTPR